MTKIEIANFHELVSEFNKSASKYEIAEMILLNPNDQDLGKQIRKYFNSSIKNFKPQDDKKI
jgi:hypothetical protein